MTAEEAASKEVIFFQVMEALRELDHGPHDDIHTWFVPGRIEFLGKHTDYAGGRSILCTAGRGFCVAARARTDARIDLVDTGARSRIELALDPGQSAADISWGNYAITVARRISRNFPSARTGADIAFASDLPQAAGMSSSSALIVAVFLVLSHFNALENTHEYRRDIRNSEELAGYLGCVENGQTFGSLLGDSGVGTLGGSEDHTAILCCRAGHLSVYSFCPVRYEEELRFPDQHVLAVGSSGVVAEKAGSARDLYNRASLATRRILEIWRAASGRNDATLAAASSVSGAPGKIREAVESSPDQDRSFLLHRLDQFLAENFDIIPSVAAALSRRDVRGLGSLIDRSQLAAERLLNNQVPETIALARSARQFGAAAATAFGAGFGGSVWALVRSDEAQEFIVRWSEGYQRNFPASADRASFFITCPGPPAVRF